MLVPEPVLIGDIFGLLFVVTVFWEDDFLSFSLSENCLNGPLKRLQNTQFVLFQTDRQKETKRDKKR